MTTKSQRPASNQARSSTRERPDAKKQFLPLIGVLLFFSGLIVLYLSLYGRNLFYTQTYYYVSRFLPPVVNFEILAIGAALLLQLLFYAIFPGIKRAGIEFSNENVSRRKIVVVFGIIMVLGALVLFVAGGILGYPFAVDITSKLEGFVAILFFAALGLFLVTLALYPNALKPFIKNATWGLRIPAFIMAMLLIIMFSAVAEVTIFSPTINQVIQTSQTTSSQIPTHSISAVFEEYPSKIQPGDSQPLTLLFRLTTYDPQDTARRYPITIDPSHKYGVSINVQSVGFEMSEPLGGIMSGQPIEVNQLLRWSWLITPKEGKEGTSQSIAFDVILHDLTENKIVFQSPATTLKVEVGTPFGLPSWLISPQAGIGAVIGGLVSIILPWVLNEISASRKKK